MFVLLLAVQMLHGRGNTTASQHTYAGGPDSFTGQLDAGQVKSVSIDLVGADRHGPAHEWPAYTISYPDATLLTQLLAQHPGGRGRGQKRALVLVEQPARACCWASCSSAASWSS